MDREMQQETRALRIEMIRGPASRSFAVDRAYSRSTTSTTIANARVTPTLYSSIEVKPDLALALHHTNLVGPSDPHCRNSTQ